MNFSCRAKFKYLAFVFLLISVTQSVVFAQVIIAEQSKNSPILASKLLEPSSTADLQLILKKNQGPFSIGGHRTSHSDLIASPKIAHIDMRKMNHVLLFEAEKKQIKVEAGITWRQVRAYLEKTDLIPQFFFPYPDASVGGSVATHAHGKGLFKNALLDSVISIKLVYANGSSAEVSRDSNPEHFYGSFGSLGALAVISEITLSLQPNIAYLKRTETKTSEQALLSLSQLLAEPSRKIVMQEMSVDLKNIKRSRLTSWEHDLSKKRKKKYIDAEILEKVKKTETQHFQEYALPFDGLLLFLDSLKQFSESSEIKISNVRVRPQNADAYSLLPFSQTSALSVIFSYELGNTFDDQEKEKSFCNMLNDKAIELRGRPSLVFRNHLSLEQFRKSYPSVGALTTLKKNLDPEQRFKSAFWDQMLAKDVAANAPKPDAYAKLPEENSLWKTPHWTMATLNEEFAIHLKNKRPSHFKYMSSAWAVFHAWWKTVQLSRREGLFDTKQFVATLFPTMGFAAEMLIKFVYENTLGRMTEFLVLDSKGEIRSNADEAYFKLSQKYASSIHIKPWYEFDFFEELARFWQASKKNDVSMIRKWERRFLVNTDYLLKTAFGWICRKMAGAPTVAETSNLQAWISGQPTHIQSIYPSLKIEIPLGSKSLISMPRRDEFTNAVIGLARDKIDILEVAQNKKMALSLVTRKDWKPPPFLTMVDQWPLFSNELLVRYVFLSPVERISELIQSLDKDQARIEMIFDF